MADLSKHNNTDRNNTDLNHGDTQTVNKAEVTDNGNTNGETLPPQGGFKADLMRRIRAVKTTRWV